MSVVLCQKFTGVNWLLVTVLCFGTKCLLKVTESFHNTGLFTESFCNAGFFTESFSNVGFFTESFCSTGFFTESFCNEEILSVMSEGQEPKGVKVEDVSYYEAVWSH